MTVATQRTRKRQQREETRRQILDAAAGFPARALVPRAQRRRADVAHRPHADGLLPPLRRHPRARAGADHRRSAASSWTSPRTGRRPTRVGADEARARLAAFVDFYVRNGPLVHAVTEAAHHDDVVEQAYDGDGRGLRRRSRPRRSRRGSEPASSNRSTRPRSRVRWSACSTATSSDSLGREQGDRPRARARRRADDLDPDALSRTARCGDAVTEAAAPAPAHAGHPALWPGPWPAEDGGPRRTGRRRAACPASDSRPASACETTAVRDALGTTMVILRDPGEVFALRHTLGRRPLDDPARGWVERLDPVTLEPLERSPDLAGRALLAGRARGARQRLAPRRRRQSLPPPLPRARAARAACELPGAAPLQLVRPARRRDARDEGLRPRPARAPRRLVLLDPETLEQPLRPGATSASPRSRGSRADGDDLYVVGAADRPCAGAGTASRLERDDRWGAPLPRPGRQLRLGPGHRRAASSGSSTTATTTSSRRCAAPGVAPGPVHLIRMSLDDPADVERSRSAARRAAPSPTRRSTTRSAGSRSATTRPTASCRRSRSPAAARAALAPRAVALRAHGRSSPQPASWCCTTSRARRSPARAPGARARPADDARLRNARAAAARHAPQPRRGRRPRHRDRATSAAARRCRR